MAQSSDRSGRTTARGGRSLTSCREAASVLAEGMPCTFADVAQQAEQGHAMAKTWVRDPSSAPLRVCPCTPLPHDMVLVARDVRGPWPDTVQRDTTSDGTPRAWAQPKWIPQALAARQAEQPPCERQAARGEQPSPWAPDMSCSSRRPRTPPFQGGDAGSSPARDARTRNLRRARASGAEIGRNDWAAPEPVTGWLSLGV